MTILEPEFNSTNEAFEFLERVGKEKAIPILLDRMGNYLDSHDVIRETSNDPESRLNLLCKTQFCREAIEKAIGVIHGDPPRYNSAGA